MNLYSNIYFFHVRFLTYHELVLNPLLIFCCDDRVFKSSKVFEIFLQVRTTYDVKMQFFFNYLELDS